MHNKLSRALCFIIPVVICSPRGGSRRIKDRGISTDNEMVGLLNNFIHGDEFGNILDEKQSEGLLLLGKCREKLGLAAGYDLEKKMCFICSGKGCLGNAICAAQCKLPMEVIKLEHEVEKDEQVIMDMQAENQTLQTRSVVFIVVVCVCVLGFVMCVGLFCRLKKYGFTSTKQPSAEAGENRPARTENNRDEGRAFVPAQETNV